MAASISNNILIFGIKYCQRVMSGWMNESTFEMLHISQQVIKNKTILILTYIYLVILQYNVMSLLSISWALPIWLSTLSFRQYFYSLSMSTHPYSVVYTSRSEVFTRPEVFTPLRLYECMPSHLNVIWQL